ncbi:hypothetical protein AMK59_6664 [Oryctes borbonicus]|uniref:Protein KRI1 homolog n=1 Tax=Oryctes borbonicus TaxID=1629725 RepID=A0A0T6AVG3_9SCAR|nr:hypothetical protein AMK59_6664 [Oryctes borbonicus]
MHMQKNINQNSHTMSKVLFDSDSESDAHLKVDNEYAKNYNTWRQKEELNKLKTKYGEEVLDKSESSTSSSEDDEDDEVPDVSKEIERNFFKTLASLKTKDPKIYDENVKFFSETKNVIQKKTKKKEQPMFIKDYERKLLLEGGGKLDNPDVDNKYSNSLSYVQEQEKLKKNLQNALQNIEENTEEEWGGMFKSRQRTDTELKQEEEEYRLWLKGQREYIIDEIKYDLEPLKDYWSDPHLDKDEKFLRDYILNKRFLENEDKNYIPTYDEVIHDSDDGLSEDEKQIEKQDEFEHKYNYRFEEPDEEFIKRYPRTIESSLRTKDDRRKVKRAEIKERKEKEKEQKMNELRYMQSLKKKEIEEKIQKLREITGNKEIAFDDKDIEEDFDPETYDKKMQQLFNDEFYKGQEEEQKPEFPDIDEELELENWENSESQGDTGQSTNGPHCEDEDFNMDCDYDPNAKEVAATVKGKKKRKRKTKFVEMLSKPKPTFDPTDKTYQEYLDEYYKLECEDIIGDIPCRFKYRKVIPNSFGLTREEILMASDRELNRWCSLKKVVQYRPEHIEKYDVIAFGKKGKNEALKRKLLPSLFKDQETVTDVKSTLSKKESNTDLSVSKKKKRKREINTLEDFNEEPILKKLVLTPGNTADSNINYNNSKKSQDMFKKTHAISHNNSNTLYTNIAAKKKKKQKCTEKSPTTNILSNNNTHQDKGSKTFKTVERAEVNNEKSHTKRTRMNQYNSPKKNNFSAKYNQKELDISDARLKAFGFKPKKFKNKMKYKGNTNTSTS